MTDREQLIEEAAKAIAEFAAQDGPVDAFHLAKVLYGRFEKAEATNWEYGAEGAFVESGEVYEHIAQRSRERAEGNIRIYNKAEEDEPLGTRCHYSLVRRRVMTPGPWEQVPDTDTTPKEEA